MNCQEYSDGIMRHFDGALNDIESAQLKQHIRICKTCNEEFEEMGSILHFIETDKEVEPPSDFEESVMKRVRVIKPALKKIPDATIKFMYGFSSFLLILLLFMFTVNLLKDGALKFITDQIEPLNSISDLFQNIAGAAAAIWGVIADLIGTVFETVVIVVKAYYYFIILSAVMLFAIQWTFFSLIKQSQGGQVR